MMDSVKQRFNFLYERNASSSYMVIETGVEERIQSYQVEMISNNPSPNILPLYIRRKDDELKFYYNITSKLSLMQFLKRKRLGKNEFIGILYGIIKPLLEAGSYFLNENSFLLEEEQIYISPDDMEVSLVYIPVQMEHDNVKKLKDLVVALITARADIEEKDSGNFLQRILGYVKREDFNISGFEKLLKELGSGGCGDDLKAGLPEMDEIIPKIKTPSGEKMLETPSSGAVKSSLLQIPRVVSPSGKEFKSSPGNDSRAKASIMSVIILQLLIAAVIAAGVISGFFESLGGGDKVATYAGVIIIAGAVDFLISRTLLNKKEAAAGNHTSSKAVKRVEKPEDKGADRHKKDIVPESKLKKIMPDEMRETVAKDSNKPIDIAAASNIKETPKRDISCETVLLGSFKENVPYLRSEAGGTMEKIPIDKPVFVIGRLKEQVDYVCGSFAVGKVHAEITARDGLYYIKDLNSRNGTFINAQRIDSNKEYGIKNNDRVSLANCEYTFIVP